MDIMDALLSPFQLAWWITCKVAAGTSALVDLTWESIKKSKKPTSHGDADWADVKALQAAGHFKPEGVLVGHLNGRPMYAGAESSVLIVAPRRQGKTQNLNAAILDVAKRPVKPVLVVGDPHGDILETTRQPLLEAGYGIIHIDLTDPLNSQKINPLSFLRPQWIYDFDRDVYHVTELMISDEKSTQPHFLQFSRALLMGTILYMVKREPKTTIYDVVYRLSVDMDARAKMFEAMKQDGDAITIQAITALEGTGKNESGGFGTTFVRKMQIWLRESCKEVLQEDAKPWRWEDIFAVDYPVAVFIKAGAGASDEEGAVTRLLVGLAVKSVSRMWNHTGKRLPHGMLLIVDEAAKMGHCRAIIEANDEQGKMGVNTILTFQGRGQITSIYGDEGQTLIGNCDQVVFGGGKDMAYYRDIETLLGDKTIANASYSEGKEHKSFHEQGAKLMKADQLRRMGIEKQVCILGPLQVVTDKPWYKTGNVRHFR